MSAQVKWWSAKLSPYLVATSVEWFDRTGRYPGFIPSRPQQLGKFVRLFRDLEAFKHDDTSLSMEVPLAWLDEAEAPE